MRPALASVGLCALVLSYGGLTKADEVSGTRSEKLYETKHSVVVTMHRGYAELRVRRTVQNDGSKHDQAMFWINVPTAAVATSLRTLGSVKGRAHWFDGELMEAEAAAEKYRELTGIGGYYPKDPALLSWRSQNLLALQVFPVAPSDTKTVEYTLLVPTTYGDGAHRFVLPGLGSEKLLAEVIVQRAGHRDSLRVAGAPVSSGHPIRQKLNEQVELALVPKVSEPVGGELAVAQAGDKRFVTHFSIEAAPRVSSLPKSAYVVIAVDASRSIESGNVNAMKSAAAAYLSHLPDAHVEVLSFDHEVHPRYGSFVDASRAAADFAAWNLTQKNGSAADLVLAEAEKLLAKTPAGHPRRIVLFTDALARSALKPDRLRAAVGKSGAVLHIGVMDYAPPHLERNDDHVWAAAARATGGLLWNASATDATDAQKAQRAVYEEWARPLRIDQVQLFSPDFALGAGAEETPPTVLDEGQGYARTFIGSRAATWIRLEGELWSKPIQQVIHTDARASKRWAALAFGSDLLDSLSEPEQMKLAMFGGAVSPVTSYLAIEPGVRPSTEGLDWGSGTGTGFGSGVGRVRMAASSVSGMAQALDRQQWLRDQISIGWLACGGTADSAHVSLESTRDEVVDVTKTEIGKTDPVLERCLQQAVWDLVLPAQFTEEWNTWSVDV